MELLDIQKEYVICLKEPGMECERQLPQLLAEQLGGTEQDYYCVHRLDRAVGGVMVYARSQKDAGALSAQIQEHRFRKEYLAVCAGCPDPTAGEMSDYLYKDAAKGRAFPVKRLRRGVKEARLEYRVLGTVPLVEGTASLVNVTLHTGRFHQIRAQFAARKLPLLGDGKYGSRVKGCAIALFSRRIAFAHPGDGHPVEYTAAPPAIFPWVLF